MVFTISGLAQIAKIRNFVAKKKKNDSKRSNY